MPTKTMPKKTLKKSTDSDTAGADEQIEEAAAFHPPMIANVPDIKVAKRYIGREFVIGVNENGVAKTKTDMELFDYCYQNALNLLIEGPTGPGKTMATRAWAASRGKLMARIPSFAGIEASQLFGKHNPDKEHGGFSWIDGPVPHVFRNGGVVLWNEVNFTPERISTVMFGALDDNREIVLLDHEGEIIRAHRGKGKCWCSEKNCDDKRVLIVADMNPDYAGTRQMNAAFRNRFAVQLVWDYDPNVELKLVKSETLRDMADKIRKDPMGYETPVSTNMLIEFERLATDLGVQFAVNNFINHFADDERGPVKTVTDALMAGLIDDFLPEPEEDEELEYDATDDEEEDFDMEELTEFVFMEEED